MGVELRCAYCLERLAELREDCCGWYERYVYVFNRYHTRRIIIAGWVYCKSIIAFAEEYVDGTEIWTIEPVRIR